MIELFKKNAIQSSDKADGGLILIGVIKMMVSQIKGIEVSHAADTQEK